MAVSATAAPDAADWGSAEDTDLAVTLPPRETTGPDASGISTVTEYTRERDGSVKKHTRRIKIATKTVYAPAAAVARRARMRPFGRAATETNNNVTSFDINLVKLRLPGEEDDRDAEVNRALEKLRTRLPTRVHGAATSHTGLATSNWAKKMAQAEEEGMGSGADSAIGHMPAPSAGRFVPSAVARGMHSGGTESTSIHDETPALKVSNLAETTTSEDLQRIFEEFGPVRRANVVPDRETFKSRGFGFVNFISKQDAEHAKEELTRKKAHINGLVMEIAWASKPRTGTTFRSGYGQALPQG